MAIKTRILPGYGIIVQEDDGKTRILPGYGVVANNEAAADDKPKPPSGLALLGAGS